MGVDIPIPEFLKESVNDIHSRMLEQAPKDVSIIEGDIFWDATRPSAEEMARIKNIALLNILKLGITQTTNGEYLDLKGTENGLIRKSATKATQAIKFTGLVGTTITEGKIVTIESIEENKAIEFKISETKSIGADGTVIINAECLTAGATGNVAIGNITILTNSINGIKEVSNVKIIKAGVDEESDDDFRDRIIQKVQTPATSGNKYHYLNWALEVTGVGSAKVFPETNLNGEHQNGCVKIVIVDSNKHGATEELIEETYKHIEECRPIGATIFVVSAKEKAINVTANISIISGVILGNVQTEFKALLTEYLESVAFSATYISIAKIGNILLNTTGIIDYKNLEVNGLTSNITLGNEEIAVFGDCELGSDVVGGK